MAVTTHGPPPLDSVLRYAAFGLTLLICITGLTCYWLERPSSINLTRCQRIGPGATVADLLHQLTGAKFYRYDGRDTWVAFTTSMWASNSIKARYDSASGRVLALYCADENGPEWSTGGTT